MSGADSTEWTGRALEAPDWRNADLTKKVFDECSIADGDFGEATLFGARFTRCRLNRCVFTHSDLREAVFEDCVFADPATQRGANFAFARLDESRFARCDLTHARFEGADLYASTFETCNMLGALFSRSRFHRAFGRKVVRAAVNLIDCNLELADLSGANLANCDLNRSRLREADLSGCDLEAAMLCDTDLFQAIIDGARMAGADLRGADVSGFDVRRLASYQGLLVTVDQQHRLLEAIGVDVHPSRG